MFPFSKSDKLLIVAPHPDDESLGTGGLLQRAFASQVPVRILFGTHGENNPWAQRFWERRWKIGCAERAGWGERRRQEALNAISVLGGQPECARFLNLPDQGITGLLMKGDPELLSLFAEEIEEWRPTLVVILAMRDAHPDHSALSVVLSMVLGSFVEQRGSAASLESLKGKTNAKSTERHRNKNLTCLQHLLPFKDTSYL